MIKLKGRHRKSKISTDACLWIYAGAWLLAGVVAVTSFWGGRAHPMPPAPPWSHSSYAEVTP